MIKTLISSSLLLLCTAKVQENTPKTFELKIDSQAFCTNQLGVAIPSVILNLKCTQGIKIYLTNGEYFTGFVNKIEENSDTFKVFGVINEKKSAGFGFAIKKDGKFGGAIIIEDDKKLYELEYSEAFKGFIFMPSIYKDGGQKS
jgi:hypothetical protein